MKPKLIAIAVLAAAAGIAGAASAQTMPHRDDPAWEVIGTTEDGTRYSIIPSEVSREHTTVWLVLKATAVPSPYGSPNTVIAYATVECQVSAISVGKAEVYSEAEGFVGTIEGLENSDLKPATNHDQLLVIEHVCAD